MEPRPPITNAGTEKVLRALFWKLFFRGRALQQARQGRKTMRTMNWAASLIFYMLMGVFVALGGHAMEVTAFSAMLHALSLVMVLLSMAASAGSFLFNHEEAEILLHRPVLPGALLRAKVWVLIGAALAIGVALNLPGLVAGCYARGGNWLFFPAHLVSLGLLNIFAAAALVLIYNLCLRWFGRERLDNLMATAQTVMTVILILASQLMPRVMMQSRLEGFTMHQLWFWLLPTSWFASFDAVVVYHGGKPWLWGPAALAVAMTALTCWLALHKLAGSYGEGLMILNESAVASAGTRKRRHWLPWLCRKPPLRWWLRDPVERSSFLLTSAYMFRDRETKMRLYPGLAPMGVYILIMLFAGSPGKRGGDTWQVALASSYLAFIPMIAMDFLRTSEHWRAAEMFRVVPLPHWKPLFHGARKAVLALLVAPSLALLLGLALWLSATPATLLLLLPNLILFPIWTLVPAVIGMWLPLSMPFDQQKQSAGGCLKMAVVIGTSMAVAGLGIYAWQSGWFIWLISGETVVVVAVWFILQSVIDSSIWDDE